MTEHFTFSGDEVIPSRVAVFENQGIPPDRPVGGRIEELLASAIELFVAAAAPAGMLVEISKADFADLYSGDGRNEPRTPVQDIFGRADALALFVVTLGKRISREIDERFQSNDFAVGCMLDSVASASADILAEKAETRFAALLAQTERTPPWDQLPGRAVLRYSPGYCGWHISGQRKLFDFLRPGQIGVSLRDSFLMEPLKSVSGVLIAGAEGIHDFPTSYPFCNRCETFGCRERIRALSARRAIITNMER